MDWDVSMSHLAGDRDAGIRLIQLRDVGLRFDDKPALFEGVNLDIEADSFILIEGTSGCGKSSFLRLLNRLQDPTQGDILVDGHSPAEADICALRRQLAWVQQTPVMLPGRGLVSEAFRVGECSKRSPSFTVRAVTTIS